MKNKTCKACGLKYHFCSSCCCGGLEDLIMDEYCSVECWRSSTKYKLTKSMFRLFLFTLNENQLFVFNRIMNLESDFIDYEICLWYNEFVDNIK